MTDMPASSASRSVDDDHRPLDLPTLIESVRLARGLDTHEDVALASVGADPDNPDRPVLSRAQVWQFVQRPRKAWMSPLAVRGLAKALGVSHAAIYSANAVSLGLHPVPGGTFAGLLPSERVDQLPIADQMAVRDVLLRLCDARGV